MDKQSGLHFLAKQTKSVRLQSILCRILLALSVLLVIPAMVLGADYSANEQLAASKADTSDVLTVAEKMPELIGGLPELYDNINYPQEAIESGIEGRVFIQFIIDEQGNPTNPQVLRDIGKGCGEAAIEAIKHVKFTPGMQDGKPVKVKFSLPVTFKIN